MREKESPTHSHTHITPPSHVVSLKTWEVEKVGENEPKMKKNKIEKKRVGENSLGGREPKDEEGVS